MGRVLLTVGRLAEKPYYIEKIGRNVYSVEELCYSLVQSAQFLDAWILDPALLSWLEKECGLPELAAALSPYLGKKDALSEFVTTLLNYTGYIPQEKQRQTRRIVQAGEGLEEWESRLARADYLRESGRYSASESEYQAVLEGLPETERSLRARALRGLGISECSRFLFALAAERFFAAWKLTEEKEDYFRFLAATRLSMQPEEYVSFATSHPEAYDCSMELEKKMEELKASYAGTPGGRQLERLRRFLEEDRTYSFESELLMVVHDLKERYREDAQTAW
ncbi:MAG: hypothetical protein Q4C60_06380 [Eubacteriales bacterium]|nr:hypothetical protein [Eubacteriales bacterium]